MRCITSAAAIRALFSPSSALIMDETAERADKAEHADAELLRPSEALRLKLALSHWVGNGKVEPWLPLLAIVWHALKSADFVDTSFLTDSPKLMYSATLTSAPSLLEPLLFARCPFSFFTLSS
mmetsp:Transcript_168649/g.298888  ORF Transcript_168649/g.298888 Transcript_168649/m.298888 type:complete len:123 (-) Transcript_168649:1122-1490(-)